MPCGRAGTYAGGGDRGWARPPELCVCGGDLFCWCVCVCVCVVGGGGGVDAAQGRFWYGRGGPRFV
jgi:hypothetical protein